MPPGRKVLWLNLDETSVATSFVGGRGAVVTERTPGCLKAALGPKASKAALRGAVTHAALVCSETALQPLLPQVIIGNKRRFTKKLLASAAGVKPPAVHLFAEKTAWNSGRVMLQLLQLLSKALQPHTHIWRPVLLLDVAPCHFGVGISATAKALGIDLVYIPARTTALLQPLDVACFNSYKCHLRREWARLQEAAPRGQVTNEAWLQLIMTTATKFLAARAWQPAFRMVGAGGKRSLGSNLQRQVEGASDMAVLPGPPSPADLELVFPRGRCPQLHKVLSIPPPRRRVNVKGPGA